MGGKSDKSSSKSGAKSDDKSPGKKKIKSADLGMKVSDVKGGGKSSTERPVRHIR